METHVVLESAINTEISRSTEGIGLQVYRMMGPGAGGGGGVREGSRRGILKL